MQHLKQNVTIDGRPINDIEAAYAYCGCSGVTVWDGTNWYYPVPKHDRFDTWMKTGVLDGTQKNVTNAKQGRKDLDAMLSMGGGDGAVRAFWSCVEDGGKKALCG
ncbi:hypothetical protein AB0L53_18655 [Nonomuraea sp. NPDC052129]|uniref:hypothetical protein n=1 Tax=Nonomuraea sp. NPDC052129 TaxID=3154651 RepID=UPI0034421B26